MLDDLLAILAPYYCICCGKMGSIVCHRCKKSVSKLQLNGCVWCGRLLVGRRCSSPSCQLAGVGQYVAFDGSDTIRQLIHHYKYQAKRGVARTLTHLAVPHLGLPQPGCLVPVPPSQRHVRQRGFDHTALLARRISHATGLDWRHTLLRRGYSRQVGAGRQQRIRQQQGIYHSRRQLDPSTHYLLVDDVVTTGATMCAAVRALRQAGARRMSLVALLHQALETPSPDPARPSPTA